MFGWFQSLIFLSSFLFFEALVPRVLSYGNPNESTFANRIILEATISFIETSIEFSAKNSSPSLL